MQKGVKTMTIITTKEQITEHFNGNEFKCKCGCNEIHIDKEFVQRLEKLYATLDKIPAGVKAIYVNSGYRCAKHSQNIKGAFIGDMHNIGAAADIHAQSKNGSYIDSITICEAAQLCGFGGIAIIDDYNAHVDDRQRGDITYQNKQWYGNESTGANVTTFIGKSKNTNYLNKKSNQVYIEIMIDDHKYSGLLSE